MFSENQRNTIESFFSRRYTFLSPPYPPCVLFCSISDRKNQANVFSISGENFEDAWKKMITSFDLQMQDRKKWEGTVKVDLVRSVFTLSWGRLLELLWHYRRDYFRYGITFDPHFTVALLEQECSANSIFYGLNSKERAEFNEERFIAYSQIRFPLLPPLSMEKNTSVGLFTTSAVVVERSGDTFFIPGVGDPEAASLEPGPKAAVGPDAALYAGVRHYRPLTQETLSYGIHTSSRFLANQMTDSGEFIYGYIPGLVRKFTGYNRVRHAGTLFALLAAYEQTQDEVIRPAIEKGIEALASRFIRQYTLPSGQQAAFLVESNGEIKLGGNGVSLVALSRWQEVTGDRTYEPLMELLAEGILHMQDENSGTFVHVLHSADLTVKEAYRTVYYDGEGLFGLARAYASTGNKRWLAAATKALDAFITLGHWKHHDHWLSYAVNEVTRFVPAERYFAFGLRNVSTHLRFILERETTYPTLLELCMAAESLIRRIQTMEPGVSRKLLSKIDIDRFHLASHKRAEYLFCGYFWPEVAMYFNRPRQLEGSFFIRHHAFRTRIDDVGHYLCGLTAYKTLFPPREKG